MTFLKRWLFGWIPFAAFSLFVFVGAILPPKDLGFWLFELNDKILHGAEYFLLFFFTANAFQLTGGEWQRGSYLKAALIYCFLIGFLTEAVQYFVPERATDFLDWIADATGALMALAIWLIVQSVRGQKKLKEDTPSPLQG